MSDTEYTGQLIGGPDDGNYVTATRPLIVIKFVTTMWLDGLSHAPQRFTITGEYVWNDAEAIFEWKTDTTVRTTSADE